LDHSSDISLLEEAEVSSGDNVGMDEITLEGLEEACPRPECESSSNLQRAEDQFILEWGRMSSSWGINRTMAQIHALLFVSGIPLEVNEIMDRLQISRGNASMNLRELMDWGVVRRFRQPGDRKDTYLSETDPYQMFVRIVKERKRREIDPTNDAIREVLSKLPDSDMDEKVQTLRARLQALLEIFDLIDAAYKQVFVNDISLEELSTLVRGAVEG
jgi:DNA-binding transcriptional regulator GbsR (MarR family)